VTQVLKLTRAGSPSTLYRWMKHRDFPLKFKRRGSRANQWSRSPIVAWMQENG